MVKEKEEGGTYVPGKLHVMSPPEGEEDTHLHSRNQWHYIHKVPSGIPVKFKFLL